MRRPLAVLACILGLPLAPSGQEIVRPVQQGSPYVKSIRVAAHGRGRHVRVKVVETLFNPTTTPQETVFLYPLPPEAQVRNLVLRCGNQTLKAELLDADRARRTYEETVRRMRDPALLEFVAWGLLRARVFPVPPRGEATLTLEYELVLGGEEGLRELRFPFAGACSDARVFVTVSLESTGIQSLYSPTHAMEVTRPAPGRVRAVFEGRAGHSRVLALYYTEDKKGAAMQVLPFRRAGRHGFVVITLSPGLPEHLRRPLPKDLVLIVDTSGSMRDGKLAQVQKALQYILKHLQREDRFQIIPFGTEVRPFARGLVPATRENVTRAQRFVAGLEAVGGTNLCGALLAGLRSFDNPARLGVALLLTDGEPTVDVTDTGEILGAVKQANRTGARLFVIGVGPDVKADLLDRLALQNRGARMYVGIRESLAARLTRFYDKIRYPSVMNPVLECPTAELYDVYPRTLPDLFYGTELVVAARFRRSGEHRLVLRGEAEGREVRWEFTLRLPETDTRYDFVPRLWALRKVGHLYDQLRLGDLNREARQEIQDSIRDLAKEYGILTPFTALLAQEDLPPPGLARGRPGLRDAGGLFLGLPGRAEGRSQRPEPMPMLNAMPMPAAPLSEAVLAGTTAYFRTAVQGTAQPFACVIRALTAGRTAVRTRVVGTKTFLLRGGIWTDLAYDPKTMKEVIQVPAFSERYFQLLRTEPELARYFAVGRQVILVWRGKVYRVTALPPKASPKARSGR